MNYGEYDDGDDDAESRKDRLSQPPQNTEHISTVVCNHCNRYMLQTMYKMTEDMMMVMMMLTLGKTDSLNPHRVRDQ